MRKKLFLMAVTFCFVALVIAPVGKAEDEGRGVGQADKGYFYLTNVSGTTIYDGNVVYYASATTVNYGDDVRLGSQATTLVAGIAMEDIAPSSIGRIQVRGYHPAVIVSGHENIAIGEELIPSGYGLSTNNLRTTVSISPRFVALNAVAGGVGPERFANDGSGGATNPTVRCLINLR